MPAGTPGFEVGQVLPQGRLARLGHPRAVVQRLPGARGEPPGRAREGLRPVPADLDDGRIAVAALATGLAQGCLEESVKYANERTAFGRPIGAFQAMQFKIADMKVAVETARLATYRAAWLRDQGRPYKAEAALAKLYASEIAVTSAREAVQVHGGYGYMEDFPVARFYRDSKVLEIGEGTSEIMRSSSPATSGCPRPDVRRTAGQSGETAAGSSAERRMPTLFPRWLNHVVLPRAATDRGLTISHGSGTDNARAVLPPVTTSFAAGDVVDRRPVRPPDRCPLRRAPQGHPPRRNCVTPKPSCTP